MQICNSVLLISLCLVTPLLGCFPDQRGGVSTDIACSQSSLRVTWDISMLYAFQQNTQGVKCVNLLQLNCMHNNTVVVSRELARNWCVSRPNLPLKGTHTFIEATSLPLGTVCQLTGCYKWLSTQPFVEQTDFALTEKRCIVTSTTETAKPLLVDVQSGAPDPTPTITHPTTPTSSHLGTTFLLTVDGPTTTRGGSTVVPSVTRSLSSHGESSVVDGRLSVLLFVVSLCSLLLLLCSLFIIVMVTINLKTKQRLKLIDRKYFDGLKDFDKFRPVNPSTISTVTTVSLSSLHDPVSSDNVSLRYQRQNDDGGYTNLANEQQCTGSLENENATVTSYQFVGSFSREPPVLCMESSTSMSFDLLSLQSLDDVMSPDIVTTIRDANNYMHHDLSIV